MIGCVVAMQRMLFEALDQWGLRRGEGPTIFFATDQATPDSTNDSKLRRSQADFSFAGHDSFTVQVRPNADC